jgi:hypothetical protein
MMARRPRALLFAGAAALAELIGYLRAKRDRIARGKPGDEPRF